MLNIVKNLRDLNFAALMNIYLEGNQAKAEEYGTGGLLRAEQEFYGYLREDFFRVPGAFYAIWEVNGKAVSALRLEPYQDGWLLEALETAPEHRRCGYARALITAVLDGIGDAAVYSHVSKRNKVSVHTHYACGFREYLDYAAYIDGTVTRTACTLRYKSEGK